MTDNTDLNTIGYESLGADINKQKGNSSPENTQGISSDKLPELSLDMEDGDMVKLADKWEKDWKDSPKKTEWETMIDDNEKYWLGRQFDQPRAAKARPMVDNLIFESLETYLPQATRRNPEPLTTLDNAETTSPEKEAFVQKVKLRLGDLADKCKFRLKLKKGARHWAIYQLGVAKFGWDLDRDLPALRIIRPKKIILDPEATIDEDGYTGARVGEYRKMEISKLIAIIGEQEDQIDPETGNVIKKGNSEAIKAIKEAAKNDLATEITFQEWWTAKYMFWRYNKHVLLKIKNPHWNYDREVPLEPSVDDYGNVLPPAEGVKPEIIEGINHLPIPSMPYSFLSVFNLGDQPMDKTSLINQNLANQDKLNKRDKQIDKNADRMNGGLVVSLARAGLTKDQAAGVTKALRKGGVVCIPDGAPREAIDQYNPVGLPVDVFNDRNDTRTRMRDIFGVSGSSRAGLSQEDTVRGKLVSRSLDTDRIGGGVTEYLEQWSDDWFNWFVQLLYVYDTEFQFNGAKPPKINVTVKEGSLLPKDSTSLANQALDLAKMNRISNLDLFKKLEYSNADEMAANAWLEINAPEILYKGNPLIAEAVQNRSQGVQVEQQTKVAEAAARQIKYELLPPEGKIQLAAKAGIVITPESVAGEELKAVAAKAAEAEAKKKGSTSADDNGQQ